MRHLLHLALAFVFCIGLSWALAGGAIVQDEANTEDPVNDAAALASGEDGYIALLAPRPRVSYGSERARRLPKPGPGQFHALAYQYESPVYLSPGRRPTMIGVVRRGVQLLAVEEVPGSGCRGGEWYRLRDSDGFICSADGFTVSPEPVEFHIRQVPPADHRALPFRYGKVNSRDALRYFELPSVSDETESLAALQRGEDLPRTVDSRMDGDYLLAIDREEGLASRPFLRTIRGRYIRKEFVEPKPMPTLTGERLGDDLRLPLAFVYGDETVPLLSWRNGKVQEAGAAEKHARFEVARQEVWAGVPVVVSRRGFAVPRARVRIATAVRRPRDVPTGGRFLHINVREQTLVAYTGNRPVFATLVSTGKEGHDTPSGLYQVREKHVSKTMRGADEVEGVYEVEEVPWTLFYHEGYAVHGAYWHNDFGNVRSHGCTNLAPADARFVYHFASPTVPKQWNARVNATGTYVYLTRTTVDS